MAQMPVQTFIDRLMQVVNTSTVYGLGTIGQELNEGLISSSKNRDGYVGEWWRSYEHNVRAKASYNNSTTYSFDCAGLIKAVLWGWSPGSVPSNQNGVPDTNEEGMKANCTYYSNDLTANITVGALLYMKGHAGIYIGGGQVIESTPAWANGVQITNLTGTRSQNWTGWGELSWVNYGTAAKAPQSVVRNVQQRNYAEEKGIANYHRSSSTNPGSNAWSDIRDLDKVSLVPDGEFGMYKVISERQAQVNYTSSVSSTLSGVDISSFRAIHGLPFQFLRHVDPRPTSDQMTSGGDEFSGITHIGHFFMNEYLGKIPVVNFIPGEPAFLPGKNEEVRRGMLGMLATGTDSLQSLFDITGVNGMDDIRYYGHIPRLDRYYEYVNTMCAAHAVFAGISNELIGGTPIKSIRWQNFNSDFFKGGAPQGFLEKAEQEIQIATGKYHHGISFAYHPGSDTSTSFSNETQESMLSGLSNNISNMAKEAQFLLGGVAGDSWLKTVDYEELQGTLADVKRLDKGWFQYGLMQGLKVVSSGANIMFPEVWRDSRFSDSSKTVEIKLRSPYADPISKYLYVMVPLYHLMALGMPRSLTDTSYAPPFILRAYSKGNFDVSLGMVDSIAIKKHGDGDDIADDMVPMAVDVTLEIKDLYKTLHMTPEGSMKILFNNTGFIDMVANNAGMSMNRYGAIDRFGVWLDLLKSRISRGEGDFYGGVRDFLNVQRIYTSIMGYDQ